MYKIFIYLFLFIQIGFASSNNIKEVVFLSEEIDDLANKDGSGLYFDIVRKIYEPLNIKVVVKTYPYNRCVLLVKQKKADAWLGSYIDEEDFALYPKYYFDEDDVTAMYKKDKFPIFEGIKSLEGKNVGWLREYGYEEYIDIDIIKHERNNRKAILYSLEADRFDVYLDANYDMEEAIKKYKIDVSKYSFYELLSLKLYPAFSKDDRGEKLKIMWDKRFKEVLEDGSLRELFISHDFEDFYIFEKE